MKKRKAKMQLEATFAKKDGALHGTMKPKWKIPHTFHTSATFIDYLHGDVPNEEAERACEYEYARESKAMWQAAEKRDTLRTANPNQELEQIAIYIIERCLEVPVNPMLMIELLACASFPTKDWNELSQEDRNRMIRFDRKKIPPLPMLDVWMLKALRVFEKFSKMGEMARPVIKNVRPGEKAEPIQFTPPILQQQDGAYHVIFNLDFSKGEPQLIHEFTEWLKLPGYRALLKKYRKASTRKLDWPLDRLKDLAAWRLYREFGNDWNEANKFANRRRKSFSSYPEIRAKCKNYPKGELPYKPGDPRPFRDARMQSAKPSNQADLFGEDADARKAKAGALKFLAELIPTEFAPIKPAMLEAYKELERRASDG